MSKYKVSQKTDNFSKFITLVHNDVGRLSYQNVQIFIMSIFKHSLHKFREAMLHENVN